MPESISGRGRPGDETPVEQLAEDADRDNPDPQTRRESFELELMDEDRSDEGADVEVEAVVEDNAVSDD